MYCRNCGTMTNGTAELCEACRQGTVHQEVNAPRPDMAREGLVGSILSVVFGIAGYMMTAFAMVVLAGESIGGGVFLGMICLALMVLAMILSIRGIKAFRRAGAMNAKRPVGSLICGIIGLCISVIGLIYFCFAFLMGAVLAAGNPYY